VSGALTTVAPLATYRNDTPYPFCPGCGHASILDHLNKALVELQLDPTQVVIVSDIGCVGLSDQYFHTNAFHGLHGRSITYAAGIKLARPELTVIVVMGDGGTGIGGTHLLSAARRNIGITVLVFNNFNFGMTGGQHSTTTPAGAVTTTTPEGNLEHPLDICGTVAANGASFVFRGTSFDKDLTGRIAEGIRHEGFSVLDIWELCTAYYVPQNRLNRKSLVEMLERLEFRTGILQRRDVPEYAAAYRAAHAEVLGRGQPTLAPEPIESSTHATRDSRFRLVVAGSAGCKVGSAVRMAARAAIASGLWAAQRNDYPVTVQSGHAISQLILSPDEIQYPGITKPDALIILSRDGHKKAARYLAAMEERDSVFTVPECADVDTRAGVTVIDPKEASVRLSKTSVALAMVTAVLDRLELLPRDAMEEAARRGGGEYVEGNLQAVAAGRELG
jgi:pyruvate/2-oxoacid:ferredoxin oxidoreductase beta subunit/Pyruvate/2-oxoacid:ferredoxin oxidoreductase gamma subunit